MTTTPNLANEIGLLLREIRLRAGFALPGALAKQLGITPMTVRRIEGGVAGVNAKNLQAWMTACGVTWVVRRSTDEWTITMRRVEPPA